MTTGVKENGVFFVEKNFMKDFIISAPGPGIGLEKVKNSEADFLEILGSKYINAILSRTSVKECSASELSNELNIPLATVYRKLKLLEDSGLVENVKTIINISGN